MALLESCCCWRSVRRGSYASAIYTMVSTASFCSARGRDAEDAGEGAGEGGEPVGAGGATRVTATAGERAAGVRPAGPGAAPAAPLGFPDGLPLPLLLTAPPRRS